MAAAKEAVAGGADQITIHLREDRRHICDVDVRRMRQEIAAPLNLEMSVAPEIVQIACGVKPATATLVPERREELTTEGGLMLAGRLPAFKAVCDRLSVAGIGVSLFIDPDPEQVRAAAELGVGAVELHTGAYCDAASPTLRAEELSRLSIAARLSKQLGLKVCAGHGIHYDNAGELAAALPEVVEYNIGHAIVARALFTGMRQAVEEMKALLQGDE